MGMTHFGLRINIMEFEKNDPGLKFRQDLDQDHAQKNVWYPKLARYKDGFWSP
jgi:hypothetical protein